MSDRGVRAWVAGGGDDLDRAAALLAAFRDSMGRDLPSVGTIRASASAIAAAGDGEYLLAARGLEPGGVCQLRFRHSVWTSTEDAWIEDVYVLEDERGAGLGGALVECAIDRARARGCARVELDVDERNAAALALYHGLGFSGDLKADERSLLLGLTL